MKKQTKKNGISAVQSAEILGKQIKEEKYEGRQWRTNFLLSRAGGNGQKMTCVCHPTQPPNTDSYVHFSQNFIF